MSTSPKPSKVCAACQRSFTWRKKWKLNWEQVKYCSKRCQGEGGIKIIDSERLKRMAWEDRTPFEAIQAQFGLSEKQVIEWMRSHLTLSRFQAWRERVKKLGELKRLSERPFSVGVFKSKAQRLDGTIKRRS